MWAVWMHIDEHITAPYQGKDALSAAPLQPLQERALHGGLRR
jgi:hypothetical protein